MDTGNFQNSIFLLLRPKYKFQAFFSKKFRRYILKLIFRELRLKFVHAMQSYVFSRFENAITLARINISLKKVPGS